MLADIKEIKYECLGCIHWIQVW